MNEVFLDPHFKIQEELAIEADFHGVNPQATHKVESDRVRDDRSLWRIKIMETISLRAHFDGKQILLDEPFELEPNMELIVIVKYNSVDAEREDWSRLSLENLERTYGADEPEYTIDMINEANRHIM